MVDKQKRRRKYTGVMQYFHNFEHDPKGLNHCHSDGNYPYTIEHNGGKHIISASIAIGHGKGGKPQCFQFTKHESGGYDMASGIKIAKPITVKPKKLPVFKCSNELKERVDTHK